MAVAALPLAPACPDCAGTGDINGAPCYNGLCDRGRVASRRRRFSWRKAARGVLDAAATPAGTLVRWSVNLPGVGGAAAVSAGSGWVAHAVWHPLPAWGVGILVAGAFGLMADRRL